MRKGEGFEDGSCLQNLNASKPRNGNHYTVSCHVPKATCALPTSPSQATCEEKRERRERRGSEHPYSRPSPGGSRTEIRTEFQGEITLSCSQRVTASQGTRRSLVWRAVCSHTSTHTHIHTQIHTHGFGKSAPTPPASSTLSHQGASCSLHRCHHHTLPGESAES